MPGSEYGSLSKALDDIVKKLSEAGIRATKNVLDTPQSIILQDEIIVSLDIESLFTNVHVNESIKYTVDWLYSTPHSPPDINEGTFKELFEMVPKNMITQRVYFRRVDGVVVIYDDDSINLSEVNKLCKHNHVC